MSELGYLLLALFFAIGGFGLGASIALIKKSDIKKSSSHDELYNRR